MLPKCLVFSDINIFIRTYSNRFLGVFPTSRFCELIYIYIGDIV